MGRNGDHRTHPPGGLKISRTGWACKVQGWTGIPSRRRTHDTASSRPQPKPMTIASGQLAPYPPPCPGINHKSTIRVSQPSKSAIFSTPFMDRTRSWNAMAPPARETEQGAWRYDPQNHRTTNAIDNEYDSSHQVGQDTCLKCRSALPVLRNSGKMISEEINIRLA